MPKTFACIVLGVVALAAIACSSNPAPPPLLPDGPEMDLDAAIYQDDASSPASEL